MSRFAFGLWLGFGMFAGTLAVASAQDTVRLAEKFDANEPYRVELKVSASGKITAPIGPEKQLVTVAMTGSGTTVYDEHILPPDDSKADRVIRVYRDVEFRRTIGDRDQKADIRPNVRRMIVLRSEKGKKAPFSPDGPLAWGEIDVVSKDVFSPTLIPGLLPVKPVRPGDTWTVSPAAVADLTDLDPVDEGTIGATFVSLVTLEGRRYAKLTIAGTVKGSTEDGPTRQKLDGTAYFDLEVDRLSYLNLKGVQEMLGPDGKVLGRIDGTFVMERRSAGKVAELAPDALRGVDLKPTPENSLLLYENPDLGVKFLYPRRWRVGIVQGRQVALEEPQGGGLLLTVEPPSGLPTAAQFQKETQDFLRQQKWTFSVADAPKRVAERPGWVDRFGFDAELKAKVRMEYAVVTFAEGGATVAARLPAAAKGELTPDFERIVRSVQLTKRIEK